MKKMKELIKKLRRIEDRFNFLISHMCDNFVEVNIQTGESVMTYTNKNMQRKNFYEEQIRWFADNIILLEDREAYLKEFKLENLLTSLRKNDNFYTVSIRVKYADGIHFLLIVNALITDSVESEEEYIISYAQDITNLRQHEEQNRRLTSISQHDALTGLYNRPAAEERINTHLNAATSMPGTLLLIDIDDFKCVNDTYGHINGDYVLKFLATAMQDVFRSDDVLARWGGDEFIVFMHNINDKVTITSRMERLRLKMLLFNSEDITMPVTLSVGIAIAEKTTSMSELFKKADEILYQVKKAGKNRFSICSVDTL
ncbi:MAG: GGDEF domain-containing protein [Christensenellaceae bacterium]